MRRRSLCTGAPFPGHLLTVALILTLAGGGVRVAEGAWGVLSDMHDYHECFGLDPDRSNYPSSGVSPRWKLQGAFKVVMIESNAPGNVYHDGEQPTLTFQLENLTDEPLAAEGRIETIRYSQSAVPGDQWYPRLRRLGIEGSVPIAVDLKPGGWRNFTVRPPLSGTRGGYGFVVDLGKHGRQFLTSAVRTFEPPDQRIQYPKQCLEHMPAAILQRLGIQAVRYGVSFITREEGARYEQLMERLEHDLKEMHAHRVTCIAEIGAGTKFQPLGRGRPHLDDDDVMRRGKMDLCWLPERDDEYEKFVYDLACRYGWPKGPITGFMLWNEPWEGLSISGWAADIPRYRNLYRRMGDAVFRARRDAEVDVLVGGCDSSTNTLDKLFPDGSDEFLPYLDFCSIHYQGLHAPVLYPRWNHRTHYKGRVRIWDTESWTANTDDRFLGVVASNRAAGYDRSLGSLSRIAVSTLSHHRVGKEVIHTEDGDKEIERWVESRPLAASYGAVQHFIGERDFREILFRNGLPWVFVFDGLEENPDDGTVVLVGDIAPLFGGKKTTGVLFETVRSLEELAAKKQLAQALAALPEDAAEERAKIAAQLESPMPMTGVSLTLALPPGCGAFDYYGNAVEAEEGRIEVSLDERGLFLRGDPERPGSFDALLEALRQSRIEGLEPLEVIACDLTAPIETRPVLKLRLTSQRNHPIQGRLKVRLGDLEISCPERLEFEPREQKWIEVKVTGGKAVPSNAYLLELEFDAGRDGIACHEESMRVNWISRRSIVVDGSLDDWKGVLPQPIRVTGPAGPGFTEEMLFPFAKFDPRESEGLAVGYVAHDDEWFYFAARIADDTPQDGTYRFAERDPDADFYPEVSYEPVDERGRHVEAGQHAKLREHRWPEGVRRFSYRRWPDIPSSMPQIARDNVLIAFNAIPMGEDGWETHLPGRMPKFVWYKTTDYEFALNKVAEKYGGGTEIWRQWLPGMTYKHFYPRQPESAGEGPAEGKLEIRYESGTRIVECALPWSEIPHVRKLRDAGRCVKFSFRVNHESRGPDMELSRGRSAAEGLSPSFHPNWVPHWPNELEFGFEGADVVQGAIQSDDPEWKLVWMDEFDYTGPPDPEKWSYEVGFVRNREAQYYTKARRKNARVEDGVLVIESHREDYKGGKYTSASIHTHGKAEWCHGRIEVRAQLPSGRGMWPAIWMLGANKGKVGWPACGEIDIMEYVGFNPDTIHANIHTRAYNHVKGTNKGSKITIRDPEESFHVYAVEWFEDRMDFYVDGKRYFSFENEGAGNDVWPFDKPHYLILNAAIGGSWGGQKGIDNSIFPQKYLIDYVRVYEYRRED